MFFRSADKMCDAKVGKYYTLTQTHTMKLTTIKTMKKGAKNATAKKVKANIIEN